MDERNIVYMRGMLLQAEIEMQGMIAENQLDAMEGRKPTFVKKDFDELITRQGVYHNNLMTLMEDR